jgi:hypothetical protein
MIVSSGDDSQADRPRLRNVTICNFRHHLHVRVGDPLGSIRNETRDVDGDGII